MTGLREATTESVAASARRQRAEMSEADWERHMIRLARKQQAILNLLVEEQGPEGAEFQICLRYRVAADETEGDWTPVEDIDLPPDTDDMLPGARRTR